MPALMGNFGFVFILLGFFFGGGWAGKWLVINDQIQVD